MVHLTLQEKKVLLFLSFVFIVGMGVTVFKKSSGCNSCLIEVYSDKKASGPLDINQATFAELVGLPGIGEKTAENIILHRSRNGAFRDVDDLKGVPGVTEARLAQCKDLITVR